MTKIRLILIQFASVSDAPKAKAGTVGDKGLLFRWSIPQLIRCKKGGTVSDRCNICGYVQITEARNRRQPFETTRNGKREMGLDVWSDSDQLVGWGSGGDIDLEERLDESEGAVMTSVISDWDIPSPILSK